MRFFLFDNTGNTDKIKLLHNLTNSGIIEVGSNTIFSRERGKSENMSKPVILKLKLKGGQIRQGVRVENEAPHIDGFLAVVNTELPNSTKYISLDAIEYFTVVNQEACNIKSALDRRYKVKVDSSL